MAIKLLLKAGTKLSPSVILGARMLQLSGLALEEAIHQELAENPALELANEEQWERYRSRARSGPSGGGPYLPVEELQVRAEPSVTDRLESEIRLLASGPILSVALRLLEALDDHGYLNAPIEDLAHEFGVSAEAIELGLGVLHQAYPPGLGARDVRECLLIQCDYVEANGIHCGPVRRILAEGWDDFFNQRWGEVASSLNLTPEALELARQFIARNFHPYPLQLLDTDSPQVDGLTGADLIIEREEQGAQSDYRIRLPAAEASELRVCESFARLREYGAESLLSKTDRAWLAMHVDRARLFISALNQRWDTLRRIGEYLIHHHSHLLDGRRPKPVPLTRRTLALELELHESTVSRAMNGKTVQLPNGRIVPLRNLFEPSFTIKDTIASVLAGSSTPMSDREIAQGLRAHGLRLARRTVAKYRQQLDISSSTNRKKPPQPSVQGR